MHEKDREAVLHLRASVEKNSNVTESLTTQIGRVADQLGRMNTNFEAMMKKDKEDEYREKS